MKKHLLLLSMLLCVFTCATAQNPKQITKKADKLILPKEQGVTFTKFTKEDVNSDIDYTTTSGPISYVTPKRDTLYLIKNSLGQMIKDVWNDHKYPEHPVILLVDKLPAPTPTSIKLPKNNKL